MPLKSSGQSLEMKPTSKSFRAACRSASQGADTPLQIRRFCKDLDEIKHMIAPVTSFEALTICQIVWNSNTLEDSEIPYAGIWIAEQLHEIIDEMDLNAAEPNENALLCALTALEMKLRILPTGSTALLYLAATFSQFAPDGTDLSDFFRIED